MLANPGIPCPTDTLCGPQAQFGPQAQLIVYLINRPDVPAATSPPATSPPTLVADIIALNGNHWRKILTILAKLSCADGDWRAYRDQQLLIADELLCFADQLLAMPGWHLVAGKANWQRMGFDLADFTPIDNDQSCFFRQIGQQKILLTPYFDYRQLPNRLIDAILAFMAAADHQ